MTPSRAHGRSWAAVLSMSMSMSMVGSRAEAGSVTILGAEYLKGKHPRKLQVTELKVHEVLQWHLRGQARVPGAWKADFALLPNSENKPETVADLSPETMMLVLHSRTLHQVKPTHWMHGIPGESFAEGAKPPRFVSFYGYPKSPWAVNWGNWGRTPFKVEARWGERLQDLPAMQLITELPHLARLFAAFDNPEKAVDRSTSERTARWFESEIKTEAKKRRREDEAQRATPAERPLLPMKHAVEDTVKIVHGFWAPVLAFWGIPTK